jgi:hypothetical protein
VGQVDQPLGVAGIGVERIDGDHRCGHAADAIP